MTEGRLDDIQRINFNVKMKRLNDDNINLFLGMRVEKNMLKVVWQYCQKDCLDVSGGLSCDMRM